MNKTENKSASRKKGPPPFVLDAFGREVRPGDKVIWTNPIFTSMELTTVESIVNKSYVRCYVFADKLGNPAVGELAQYGKRIYTRSVATWKVCGAKAFPKRNPPRTDK